MNHKTVISAAGFLLAGTLGVFAFACHSDKNIAQENRKLECNCPILALVEDNEEIFPDGPFPECAVCTVWSDQYRPCSPAVAACPAIAAKPLNKAPICETCKKKIRECARMRSKCPICGKEKTPCIACEKRLDKQCVKRLMTPESMKANMNCPACAAMAEKAARMNAMKMQSAVCAANGENAAPAMNDGKGKMNSAGKPAVCPRSNRNMPNPAVKPAPAPAATQPENGVLVIEEGEITVTPAPAPAAKPAPAPAKPAPTPAKPANNAAYPIPAPPQQAPQNVMQPQGPTAFPMAGAEF